MRGPGVACVAVLLLACVAGCDGGREQPPPVELQQGALDPCTHSTCQQGAKLVSGCDWCTSVICGLDPYCCNTAWDAQCVSEVASDCGQRCDCNSLCTVGNPYASQACPPCTNTVCGVDPYCCRWGWDSTCVGELLTYCGKHCP